MYAPLVRMLRKYWNKWLLQTASKLVCKLTLLKLAPTRQRNDLAEDGLIGFGQSAAPQGRMT